jgi:hypothetical protein
MSDNVLDMKPAAQWTPDCQGKWDYDGQLVSISSRYWPRGGGFHVYNPGDGRGLHPSSDDHPEIKPSANAAIHILCGEPDENGRNSDYAYLVEKNFEADTEEEVKAAVGVWVAEQYTRIVKCLLVEYGKEKLETA